MTKFSVDQGPERTARPTVDDLLPPAQRSGTVCDVLRAGSPDPLPAPGRSGAFPARTVAERAARRQPRDAGPRREARSWSGATTTRSGCIASSSLLQRQVRGLPRAPRAAGRPLLVQLRPPRRQLAGLPRQRPRVGCMRRGRPARPWARPTAPSRCGCAPASGPTGGTGSSTRCGSGRTTHGIWCGSRGARSWPARRGARRRRPRDARAARRPSSPPSTRDDPRTATCTSTSPPGGLATARPSARGRPRPRRGPGPTGRVWVDDEDEFAEHRVSLGYPADVVRMAATVVRAVQAAWHRAGRRTTGRRGRWWLRNHWRPLVRRHPVTRGRTAEVVEVVVHGRGAGRVLPGLVPGGGAARRRRRLGARTSPTAPSGPGSRERRTRSGRCWPGCGTGRGTPASTTSTRSTGPLRTTAAGPAASRSASAGRA